jgi:hypothetical protein
MKCCGTCTKETVLDDLLGDSIVSLVMTHDGVTRSDVESLLHALPIRPKN